MKKIHAFIICLACYLHCTAQSNYSKALLLRDQALSIAPASFENQYNDIKGSAYYQEQWSNATIVTASGTYTDQSVKFDLYKNTLFLNRKDTILDLSSANILRFILDVVTVDSLGKHIFERHTDLPSIQPNTFVEVLAEGNYTLLKYIACSIAETQNGMYEAKEKNFIRTSWYFIKKGNAPFSLISISKKSFDRYPLFTPEERKYLDGRSIKYNNETGWIIALQALNNSRPG